MCDAVSALQLYIEVGDLVDAVDAEDAVHNHLKLANRVYRKVNGADGDAVDVLGLERRHCQVQLVGDAVDKVAHKVVAVDTLHTNLDGVEEVRILSKGSRYDGVAILRRKADDFGAVTLVEYGLAVAVVVADNLIFGQWVAERTARVW